VAVIRGTPGLAPFVKDVSDDRNEKPATKSGWFGWFRKESSKESSKEEVKEDLTTDGIVACWGFGDATTKHAMPLYTASQLFTASAFALLVKEGKVNLEDTCDKFLNASSLDSITVGQLLTHRSGLSDSPIHAVLEVHRPNKGKIDCVTSLTHFNLYYPRGEVEDPRTWLHSAPRGEFANLNYQILGTILEQVTDKPFEEALKESVLDRVGCKDVAFSTRDTKSPLVPGEMGWFTKQILRFYLSRDTYSWIFDEEADRKFMGNYILEKKIDSNLMASSGLVGTVRSFAPLVHATLSNRFPEFMFAPLTKERLGVASRLGGGIGWKSGYTEQVVDGEKIPFFNHEGGGLGFTTEIRIYPSLNIGMIVFLNVWNVDMKECWAIDRMCETIAKNSELFDKQES